MRQKRIFILLAMLIVVSLQASAATVYGTIYDFSLQQTENVRVSINTTPEQQIIAVNGRYSFNVPPGDYMIDAEQLEFGKIVSKASEEITIKDEGSYIRDIVLFPYFSDELMDEADSITVENISTDETTNKAIIVLLVFIALLLIFLLFRIKTVLMSLKETMFHKKEEKKQKPEKKHKEVEEKTEKLPRDLQEIVDFIKSQENRVTQKDIRKQFPKSEAKISLLIADLEKRGLVEKIKKGRGNIVVLK